MPEAKIDLNTANKDDLKKILGISDDVAQKIIEYQHHGYKFWNVVDQQFKDIVQAGKDAFVLNRNINLLVVIIGTIIIGSTLSYSWIYGVNLWSTLTSGIGIASFVIVFFNNPQSNISKAVASLASVSMIYKSHQIEFEQINSAMWGLRKRTEKAWIIEKDNLSKVEELNKALQDSTKCYVNLVNSHLEVFNADTSKSKDQRGISKW
jgi:hypothetical protein